jgi:hypothetical protein
VVLLGAFAAMAEFRLSWFSQPSTPYKMSYCNYPNMF